MFFQILNQLLSKTVTPHPNYIKDPRERTLIAIKTKAQIFLYLLILTILVIQTLNGTYPLKIMVFKISGFSCLLISLLIFCRSHLHVHYVIMTVYVSIIPTVSAARGETFFSIGAIFVGVLFLYVATDTWYYYIIAAVVYLFNLNVFIKQNVEYNIDRMSPQQFSHNLTSALTIQMISVLCFFCPVHIAKKNMNSDLQESKSEAEGSLSRYKTFLFSFSHEIRNPINILLGSIELALQENLPRTALEMVQTAKISGELLLQLVNNVLDVGKAEVGKLEIVPTPTRSYDLLLRMWNISSELIKKKGLSGYLKISSELPVVLKIDPDRLNQVLLNLIGNAVKFTERGAVNLTVDWIPNCTEITDKTFGPVPFDDQDEGIFDKNESLSVLAYNQGPEPGHLNQYYVLTHMQKINTIIEKIKTRAQEESFRYGHRKGILRVTVADQGCGMSNEAMKGLFRKFYQCSREASQRKRGTGLGLYITKDICEGMGGQIRVYSKEGIGSVFIVCIRSQELEDQY